MNKKVIIKYAPGANIKIEKIEVDDVYDKVSTICYGYESVYTNRIASIQENIEMICCDNIYDLPKSLKKENLIGTWLYDQNYPILGNICIVKSIVRADGYDIAGFTEKQADKIIQKIKSMLRKGE